MEPVHFDRIAKLFAGRRMSRRLALTRGGAGLGAAAAPDPAAGHEPATKVPFLFVQSYQSGRIAPVEGEGGRYTLALEQGHGQTVYFSDRPDRVVGVTDTPRFLEGLGFPDDNPPNAALVVETAPGQTDIAVVELFAPLYDPVSRGVTYEIEVLGNWQAELELGFHEAPTDLAALAPAFGTAHLFIDDCPNGNIDCTTSTYVWNEGRPFWGTISANAEMCWNYSLCQPCEPYGHTYPDYCAGYTYWRDKCNALHNNCGGDGCQVTWNYWFMPACW